MAVRSKRLWGPTTVGTTNVLLYTCPADETALLKTLSLVNSGALAATFTLKLNGTGGAQSIIVRSVPPGLGDPLVDLFIVLQPGNTLHGVATAAGFFVAGFGAELEGVAD